MVRRGDRHNKESMYRGGGKEEQVRTREEGSTKQDETRTNERSKQKEKKSRRKNKDSKMVKKKKININTQKNKHHNSQKQINKLNRHVCQQLPYISDYKTRFFAKFKASKSKGRLIHRE